MTATPDVVLGCAGDIPTLETLAAAALLREHVPDLRFRVVNVVDLLAMSPAPFHPHALSSETFTELFTDDIDVVMAFHGYARAFHQVVHGRPNAGRFHVRGYNEHGTTTTPFDMVVLNEMSRYHLVMEALHRARRTPAGAAELHRLLRGTAAPAPRLRPRALRGHARDPRLAVAGMSAHRSTDAAPV